MAKYRLKDILLSFLIMLLIISLGVTFILHFRSLYYWDIENLNIVEKSGYDFDTIKKNYDILIDYNTFTYRGELKFEDFPMSVAGRIHFEEVKNIFDGFQILLVVTLALGVILISREIKNHRVKFLKYGGILTIVAPIILGILIWANWDVVFVKFHELVFNNDYWIFDASTDPVIRILPDEFFMHCAIGILVVSCIFAILSIVLGIFLEKKINKKI